jgi:hypothetical protein
MRFLPRRENDPNRGRFTAHRGVPSSFTDAKKYQNAMAYIGEETGWKNNYEEDGTRVITKNSEKVTPNKGHVESVPAKRRKKVEKVEKDEPEVTMLPKGSPKGSLKKAQSSKPIASVKVIKKKKVKDANSEGGDYQI